MYKKVPKNKFLHNRIIVYLNKNPKASNKHIADKFGASYQYVLQLRKRNNLDKALEMSKPSSVFLLSRSQKEEVLDKVAHMEKVLKKHDMVNHPAHYKTGGIETIDFIEAKSLTYNLGNVVKYITRADHKSNKLEDLKKAQWYLNREVSNLEK